MNPPKRLPPSYLLTTTTMREDSRQNLAHVGTLPIVLRAILQAQSANVNRIIVAANRMAGNVIRRELLRTRRLPETVEWFEMDGGYRSLPRLIAEVAARLGSHFSLAGRHDLPLLLCTR